MEANRQSEHNAHLKYRPDIDGLRAIAILSVVIFHAFPAKLRGGFVGVDIFFVISGFLISSIILRSLQRGDFSFAEFYAHRARRIFPALIVMLTATYTFGWFVLLPDEFSQFGKHMAASAGFMQNIVLFKEAGYFDIASELKPLMHLWSLAIEEQFYLIYPLLIWAAWRMGLNVLTIVIVLALVSFGLNLSGIEKNAAKTFFLPQTRFWELLAGAILAYLKIFKSQQVSRFLQNCLFHPLIFRTPPEGTRREVIVNNLLATLGLLLIVASLITIHKGRLFPGWWALAPAAGALLLIMSGPAAWVNRNLLANRFMVMIGLISYPLYLWHWPILSFAKIMKFGEPSSGVILGSVAASVVLAWLTYKLVEKPVRFGRNARVKTVVAAVLLAAVGLAGFTTYKKEGLDFRAGVQDFSTNARDLSWDLSDFKYGKCDETLIKQDPIVGYCSLSKPGDTPTMAIIGDSHADSIFHGIAKNDDRTWLLIGNSSCAPVTGVDIRVGDFAECKKLIEKSVDYVSTSETINTVVLSFFGNYALDSNYAADHRGKGNGLEKVEITSDIFKSKSKIDLFYLGLEHTVSQLEKAGKTVVITIDMPELPFYPRSCIDRPLVKKINDCVIPRNEVDQRQTVQRTIIGKLVLTHPKIKVYDPIGMLCDETLCRAVIDEVTFYRDSHHLSLRGSNLYGKRFLTWLEDTGHSK